MKTNLAHCTAALGLALAAGSGATLADVPIPPIPATHPRVLLVGAELQGFRDALAAQRPAIKRFKEQMVDLQLGGANIYAYEPWYSAFMGVVTQQPQYCAHAVASTDAFLDSEIAAINAGEFPSSRADSYLEIGPNIGSLALVYDWCYANLTATQKLRWGNYADRFIDNVWHQETNHWGVPTAINGYSWAGPPRTPGTNWSIDNPVNNYYYSFLRATMLWGLVSKGEPGRAMADGFLQIFRNQKIQNQLVPTFNAQLIGGGSREGTGYGTAMRGLFGLYHLWERTTGERISDLTTHTRDTMSYMLHATSPNRNKLAPIGDHARDSTATFYDYHRDGMLATSYLSRGTPLARNVRDFLALSNVPVMGDRFNWVYDVIYDYTETTPPASLNTAYFAPGTGHFFARSSWATNATWLTFLTGAYTESHAHPDGLSLMLYKNGWLVNDANMQSSSGLANLQEAHGLVTQRRTSDNALLSMWEYSASPPRAESSARVRAMSANPAYTYVSSDQGTLFEHPNNGDQGVRAAREIVFVKPDTVIVFDRTQYTLGASVKTFQLPTPGPAAPTIAGRIATFSNGTSTLKVHALSPTTSVLSVTTMASVDSDFTAGHRFRASVTGTGQSQFLHVLSVDNSVSAAVRGATDGAATLTLSDGRTVIVNFNLASQGGTIEIRDAGNQVIVSEALATTAAIPPVSLGSAPTDFTADGKSDLVWQHADGRAVLWLMNGTAPTATAQVIGAGEGWTAKHVADFNGDGKADILWRHNDGRVVIWLMNGLVPTSTQLVLGAGSGWSPVRTGDLNGDGKADILWRHTDGTMVAWLMNGTAPTSTSQLLGPASGWTVAQVADFNGDGRSDILWRHVDGRGVLWIMNGLTAMGTAQLIAAGGGWTAAQVGDFNGDGKADILWQHPDGRSAIWLMNGLAPTSTKQVLGAGDGWSAVRIGDLNGDGKSDILWQHTNGRVVAWLMNGASPTSTSELVGPDGWSPARLADLNGDGKADILWRHTDGTVIAWLMNGTTTTGSAALVGAGSGWSVPALP